MKKILTVTIVSGVMMSLLYGSTATKELNINACGVDRGAFVNKLAKEFSKKFKIKVNLNKHGGDRDVISALDNGKANLGFGCRALLNLPIEKKLKSQQVAWGVLAFLVNKQNVISNITIKQVKDILKGKIRNWKELGGANAPIHLYLRKPGVLSGVGYSLRKIVFKNLRVKLRDTKYIVANSDTIRKAISKDKLAFAVGDGTSAAASGKVKILKVNGIEPSKRTMASKKYRALRPYFIYMPKNLSTEAKKFIAFSLSKSGQKIIAKSYAASIGEGQRVFKLLSESAKFENFKTDNEINMGSLIKKYANQELTVYACGIDRVAFAQETMKEFIRKYGVKIKTNSSGGDPFILGKLQEKEADIAFICRAPFKEGKEKDLWSVQIAWGALAMIVNPKNQVSDLSTEQIKAIISGKIKNWKEVGGADSEIHLVLRKSPKSGVGSSMRGILFKNKNYKLSSVYTLVKNSGEARRAVFNDELAIAVDDVTSSQRVKGIKILDIDGVTPTKRAIIENDYKFRRPFYACMRDKPSKLTKLFINFVLSQNGQKIISKVGTANLDEGKDSDSQNNFILQKLKFRMQGRVKDK